MSTESSFMSPVKSRTNPDMVMAFTSVYNKLVDVDHQPKHHVLDNECSHTVQTFLDKKSFTGKMWRRAITSAVEPAVKTATYHIIATVATLDASCPSQLWCKIISTCFGPCNRIATWWHTKK